MAKHSSDAAHVLRMNELREVSRGEFLNRCLADVGHLVCFDAAPAFKRATPPLFNAHVHPPLDGDLGLEPKTSCGLFVSCNASEQFRLPQALYPIELVATHLHNGDSRGVLGPAARFRGTGLWIN